MENDSVIAQYRKSRELMQAKRRLSSLSHRNALQQVRQLNQQNSTVSRISDQSSGADQDEYESSILCEDDCDEDHIHHHSHHDHQHPRHHRQRRSDRNHDDDDELSAKDGEEPAAHAGRRGSQSWKNVRAVMAYYYALRKIKRCPNLKC